MTHLRDTPLWEELVAWARTEAGIDWPDEDLANVVGKIHAPTPDDLPETIGKVLLWCGAAERSGDDEAEATVALWRQLPVILIEITLADDGRVRGALIPLPDLPENDPRFLAAYLAAETAAPPARSRSAPGTIGALCTAYLRSADFRALATSTRAQAVRIIDKIREERGRGGGRRASLRLG